MGWSIGFDAKWDRDIGYGVPAECDYPDCKEEIDRGLSYVCGSDPYGGEFGCGLYFCGIHLEFVKPRGSSDSIQLCSRCKRHRHPFKPKPDVSEWINHKLTDESWSTWRAENVEKVIELSKKYNRIGFDLKKPCKDCPFKVEHEADWIPEAISNEEMIQKIHDAEYSQGCHRFNDGISGESQEEPKNPQYCAGAILSMMKRGISNKILDEGKNCGKFNPDEMDTSIEVI